MPEAPLVRGRVYWADIGQGDHPYLVVSNNARNQRLDDCLAVRLTSNQNKPQLASIVDLAPADEPLRGKVLCDDIFPLYRDEVRRDGGALSPQTMMNVAAGLRSALAL